MRKSEAYLYMHQRYRFILAVYASHKWAESRIYNRDNQSVARRLLPEKELCNTANTVTIKTRQFKDAILSMNKKQLEHLGTWRQ